MPIPHDSVNTDRHARRYLTARTVRNHLTGACLILLSAFSGLLWVTDVSAQEFPPEGPGSWGLIILSNFPEVSAVGVGDVIDDLSIDAGILIEGESLDETNTYSLWQIEPADAARILTPMPNYPLYAPVEIEFLRATTVTVRVRGYSDEEDPPQDFEDLGVKQLEFTFNVQASTDATPDEVNPDGNTQPSALSANERQTQIATDRLCDAARGNAGLAINEQDQVLATCNSLALFDDPAQALDRISAEELFAIGDALTITADNQISNVQARINTLRARDSGSNRFDISSLNIQLWDQRLSGSMLSAGKDALSEYDAGRYAHHTTTETLRIDASDELDVSHRGAVSSGTGGGGASQDVISDSALGMFVNGTLTVGDVDGKGIQRDADITTNALTVGADYRLDNQKVVGAAFGIVNDHTEFSDDDGNMDMQGFSLSAFGSWYEEDKGYADIIIDIGQHAFDLSRRVNLPGQPSEFANGAADASRMALSMNAGRTFQRGATEFGPVVRVALTRSSIGGFRETSSLAGTGNALELDVKSHTMTSIRFSLGAEVRHVINTSKAVLVPTLRMDLETENETDKGVIAAAFVNDPAGNTINFIGADRDRTALLLSVGTTAVFKYGQSAFVFVETRTQDEHLRQSRIRLGYRTHF